VVEVEVEPGGEIVPVSCRRPWQVRSTLTGSSSLKLPARLPPSRPPSPLLHEYPRLVLGLTRARPPRRPGADPPRLEPAASYVTRWKDAKAADSEVDHVRPRTRVSTLLILEASSWMGSRAPRSRPSARDRPRRDQGCPPAATDRLYWQSPDAPPPSRGSPRATCFDDARWLEPPRSVGGSAARLPRVLAPLIVSSSSRRRGGAVRDQRDTADPGDEL
jgi:hypothetical protein